MNLWATDAAEETGPPNPEVSPSLDSMRRRKQVLDAGWMAALVLLSMTAMLLAWLDPARFVPAPIGWALFACGLAELAASRGLDRIDDPRHLERALFSFQLAGVALLSVLFFAMGGLQNPGLLFLFAVPASLACIHRTTWQGVCISATCFAAVALGAVIESPELRWYLRPAGLSLREAGPAWLEAWVSARPFMEVPISAGQRVGMLATFGLGLVTLSLVAEGMRRVLDRALDESERARAELAREDCLALEWLRASPVPTLLVYSDTAVVLDVSDSFEHDFDADRASCVGQNLFDAVDWSHPEAVEDLLRSGGGELKAAMHRIGERVGLARVEIRPLRREDRECALVTLADASRRWLLGALLESSPAAEILIAPDARIAEANERARTLFPGLAPNARATSALALQDLDPQWWQPAPLSVDEVRITLDDPVRRARCEALRLPGEPAGWVRVSIPEPETPQ